MTKTTIAFVDDHPILLDGIVALFSRNTEFDVVGSGSCASDAVAIAQQHRPDVLVADLSMPGHVLGALAEISHLSPATRTVVFTAFSSIDSALSALDVGVSGFILKGSTVPEILGGINAVLRGEVFISPSLASQVIDGLRTKARDERSGETLRLSFREQQIVDHLMNGRTNREIAVKLTISEKTVKHYMTTLMQKLNARNRVEVVIAAQQRARPPQPMTIESSPPR